VASGANSEPTPGPVFDEASPGTARGDAEYRRWRPGRRIAENGPPVRVARKQKGLIRRMMNTEARNSARPTAHRSLAREHSDLLGTYVCTHQSARNTSTPRHQQGVGPLFAPAATSLCNGRINRLCGRLRQRVKARPDVLCVLPVFALFLVIRLFSFYPHLPLAGDQLKYLTLARNFPLHTLYNHSLYLIHPPLIGWSIACFDTLFPLPIAGLVSVVFFACVTFWLLFVLMRELGLDDVSCAVGLAYLSMNGFAAAFDCHVSRTALFMALSVGTFLSFHRYVTRRSVPFWVPLVCNALALWTSDQALALLPCQFMWALMVSERKRDLRPVVGVLVASGIVYAAWPAVRLMVYLTNVDYPAGMDGLVEPVGRFSLLHLIQPNLLPWTSLVNGRVPGVAFSLKIPSVARIYGVPSELVLLPRWVSRLLVSAIVGSGLVVVVRHRDRRVLGLLAMGLLLYSPVLLGLNAWYGLPVVLPFSLLISVLVGKLRAASSARAGDRVCKGLCGSAVVLAVLWVTANEPAHPNIPQRVSGGSHFLFGRTMLTRGQTAALSLPGDSQTGFMAPVFLVPEMVYLADRRWIAMPLEPEQLIPIAKSYGIEYLFFSSRYLEPAENEFMNVTRSRNVVRHIVDHPESFDLVDSWDEALPACYPPTTHYLYHIVREALPSREGGPGPGGLAEDE
jgi:hypothetical protein